MITRYVDYLDQLVMYVPSCPNAIILNAIKRAGRKFCEDSEAWRAELLIDTVVDQAGYELVIPARTQLKRVVDGGVHLHESLLWKDCYSIGVSELRADEHAPSGAVYVASGAGMCDGASPVGYYKLSEQQDSFRVYEGVGIEFRLLVDDLAVKVDLLKTGSAELNGWKIVNSTDPVGTYAPVHGTGVVNVDMVLGTEVPNPVIKLNCTPRDAVEGGLKVSVVLVPEYKSDGLPIDFLNRYGDGIMGGALDILMRMPNSPWSNVRSAADFKRDYFTQVSRARKDNLTGRRY